MADIPQFTPARQDMVQWIWFERWERWSQGICVYSGGKAHQSAVPAMSVAVDEIITNYGTTVTGTVAIDAHDDTLARIDVLYQTSGGAWAIHKGDFAAIDDPLGNYNSSTHANWTQLASPYPKASLPAGVPTYLVFVGPAVTEILDIDLCPLAAKALATNPITGQVQVLSSVLTVASGSVQKFDCALDMEIGYDISGTAIISEW
jgi:hypothetical protein